MGFRICGLALLLTGCADFPVLDGTIDEDAKNAPFPRLVNIQSLQIPSITTDEDTGDLSGRLNRLNAEAEALRRATIN